MRICVRSASLLESRASRERSRDRLFENTKKIARDNVMGLVTGARTDGDAAGGKMLPIKTGKGSRGRTMVYTFSKVSSH